jgi:hypothetical protein
MVTPTSFSSLFHVIGPKNNNEEMLVADALQDAKLPHSNLFQIAPRAVSIRDDPRAAGPGKRSKIPSTA